MSSRDHRDKPSSRSHHRDNNSRSRSPSPDRSDRHRRHHHHHRHRHDRSHDRERRENRPEPAQASAPVPVVLPYHSRELSKRDLTSYEPMFAMYLDIQKGILLEDLSEEEVKGRWKSFMRKWNRGELAEGWYDPGTLEKARKSAQEQPPATGSGRRRTSPDYARGGRRGEVGEDPEMGGMKDEMEDDLEDDEDEYGPVVPHNGLSARDRMGPSSGPTIPTIQDLELRKESAIEDAIASRHDARTQYRAEVRSHRSEVRHIEDEIAPRAEPGTHERRMEKRREAAAANRAFAESRRGGSPTDAAPDENLLGSGENDLDAIKNSREREQRKKNEREIRREEILRARAAEREERLQQYRQKEDETIGWLKTLAKQRFG